MMSEIKQSELASQVRMTERPQSGSENAQASAPQPDRVAPSLLAHALEEIGRTIDASSPGAMTRMTAGDFVATVVGSLRLVGEVPRRLRVTPVVTQTPRALSYAQAVSAGPAARKPRSALKSKRSTSTLSKAPLAKAVETRRKQVLNACINTLKRTKNPASRTLYSQYVPGGVAQIRDYVRKMSAEQLFGMPRDVSALLGCGLIPKSDDIRNWSDEGDVERIEKTIQLRQRGEARKANASPASVGRVSPSPPAQPSSVVPPLADNNPIIAGARKKVLPTLATVVSERPVKQKKLPPKPESRSAYRNKVNVPSSGVIAGGVVKSKGPAPLPQRVVLDTPLVGVVAATLVGVTGVVNTSVVNASPRLSLGTTGFHLAAAARKLVAMPAAKAFKVALGDTPVSKALGPDEIKITYQSKPGSGVFNIVCEPVTVKESPPRIRYAACLLATHPDLTKDDLRLRAAFAPSTAGLMTYVGAMQRAGWTLILSYPHQEEKDRQSRLESKDHGHIDYEPCHESHS